MSESVGPAVLDRRRKRILRDFDKRVSLYLRALERREHPLDSLSRRLKPSSNRTERSGEAAIGGVEPSVDSVDPHRDLPLLSPEQAA